MEHFEQPILQGRATLTAYLHDYEPVMPQMELRPAVIICPGGGYKFVSPREGEAVALAFLQMGLHAFILRYTTQGDASVEEMGTVEHGLGIEPLAELGAAMQCIRANAKQWRVVPDKIAVCGFSAGAHLAGSLGVHYADESLCERLHASAETLRPDAMILSYPVITQGEFAHKNSFINLLGSEASAEEREKYSLECQVKPTTPPTFLWHTVDDPAVPVENSLLMARALQKQHVPFEMHLFNSGVHGLSVCTYAVNTENPHASNWVGLCAEWIKSLFAMQ